MSKYDQLKRYLEVMTGPALVDSAEILELIAQHDVRGAALDDAAFEIRTLSAELERLTATNEQITAALYDQIEITHQHRLESDGLKAERDQMRELLMRLVDLQNSGRGPIRSYELWNDVVNQARPLLGLEVRHV